VRLRDVYMSGLCRRISVLAVDVTFCVLLAAESGADFDDFLSLYIFFVLNRLLWP
jgi:hypothetical protein